MSMTDIHKGHRDRLRARYIKDGLDSFEDHQVLELLLFYSIGRKDTNEIAHRLLKEFGSLSNVFEASAEELMRVDGIGENSAVLISCISGLFRRYNQSLMDKNPRIETTGGAMIYAKSLLTGRKYENLYVICMDGKGEIIHSKKIAEGTLDEVSAYPRKIVESALQSKAHSVILAHNHPGGPALPSEADLVVTRKAAKALALVDIDLRDHIIVGKDNVISLKEINAFKRETWEV